MMNMLHGLQSIAAQRGDGLRPELRKLIAPSPERSSIEIDDTAVMIASTAVELRDRMERRIQSDEITAAPWQKHD